MAMTNNPLLNNDYFPAFSAIQAQYIELALDKILADNRARIEVLLDQTHFSWENLIMPLIELDERLSNMWSPVSHLNAVMNNEELRQTYEACLPKLSAYATEMGQNKVLYQAYRSIKATQQFQQLDTVQQKIIDDTLRDFKLAGVALADTAKQRYGDIQQRLAELCHQFSNNVLDATHAWHYHTTDETELSGLPDTALQTALATAQEKHLDGWVFTLDAPCYIAIMTYADSAKLRESFYRAYTTRASELSLTGEFDNSELMLEIVQLRQEKAQLLGFDDFTHYSLVDKMAENPEQVMDFLQQLTHAGKQAAQTELNDLIAFAKHEYGIDTLHAWDIAYYSEKLQQSRFNITQEALRPYFSQTNVVNGLFTIINKLYGMQAYPLHDIDTWHPDVTCYRIDDAKGNTRGYLYMDLFARPNKRGGAWMDVCRQRHPLANGQWQHPIAYLNCNFNAPVNGQPALLTHDEVVTLFHEFGHCLHHILTKVPHTPAAGIEGVEWDAVELPSQFFENWCWQAESLALFAQHYQTGEPLPQDKLDSLIAAKNFHSALQLMRQLEFSLFDFQLHQSNLQSSHQIQVLLNNIRQQIAIIIPPAFNRFQHSFSHIFAGGYAAGYYSYKWAEVLAADAFARFQQEGIFNATLGQAFLSNILERGSSQSAMQLFIAFRGREPSIQALMESSGIQ